MFSYVKELMEREAAIRTGQVTKKIRYQRRINIIYYSIFFIEGFLALFVIVTGFLIAGSFSKYSYFIECSSVIIAFIIILAGELNRDNYQFLQITSCRVKEIIKRIKNKTEKDFLSVLLWISVAALWIPLLIALFTMMRYSSKWLLPSSDNFKLTIEAIKSIFPFLAALLGAQLTLFTFVTGSFLGRYSGNLAGIVIRHKAFVFLIIFSVLEMALLSIGLMFGYPDGFLLLPATIGALTIVCMILSMLITIKSIESGKAIVYSGFHLAKIIKRKMKEPSKNEKVSIFWKFLASVALDWRNPDRFTYVYPQQCYCDRVIRYLNVLFDATSKAIQNGEQEIFRAGLTAILEVVKAYTEKRASYYASDDEVFTFLNNRTAALMHAASKISNEYLITDAIKFAGFVGKLSLDIGNAKKIKSDNNIVRDNPRGHAIALHWIGLVKEGFDASLELKRSTGAIEAQGQLVDIAVKAIKEGCDEVVLYNYLPTLKDMHKLCLENYDGYRKDLASNNYKHILLLLVSSIICVESRRKHFYINKQIIKDIEEMVTLQHKVGDILTFNFSDIISSLVTKISSEKVIIQDIILYLNRIPWPKDWEQRAAAEEISKFICLIRNIAVDAINSGQITTVGYMEALYEILYMILNGSSQISCKYIEGCVKNIFAAWREFMQLCRDDNKHNIFQWEQPMFSLIGYGMLILDKKEGDENECLKKEITESVTMYFNSVKKEHEDKIKGVSDDTWDYLQLIGAWVVAFLKDDKFANDIMKYVASGRSFSYSLYGMRGSSSEGRYVHLGYPSLMYGDFFMLVPKNIERHLNEDEGKEFNVLQKKLMSDEVLVPFYEKIEKIRRPLGEEFHKRILKERKE